MNHASSAWLAGTPQPYWDWRAAGNFICGGSGAGVLIYGAAANARWLDLAGAALIAGGLLGVWFEIGKPTRALNVFRRPGASWMSREAIVALALLASVLAAAWLDSRGLRWLSAALAAVYVYCQARMLNAARGIPAWRSVLTVPVMVSTGLAEGVGLGILAGWSLQSPTPPWAALLLVTSLLARAITFSRYWHGLARTATQGSAPRAARVGHLLGVLDAAAIAAAIAAVAAVRLAPLVVVSALIAAGAGWWLKYTLVIRWSFEQPFVLPVPVARSEPRGGPTVPSIQRQ